MYSFGITAPIQLCPTEGGYILNSIWFFKEKESGIISAANILNGSEIEDENELIFVVDFTNLDRESRIFDASLFAMPFFLSKIEYEKVSDAFNEKKVIKVQKLSQEDEHLDSEEAETSKVSEDGLKEKQNNKQSQNEKGEKADIVKTKTTSKVFEDGLKEKSNIELSQKRKDEKVDVENKGGQNKRRKLLI